MTTQTRPKKLKAGQPYEFGDKVLFGNGDRSQQYFFVGRYAEHSDYPRVFLIRRAKEVGRRVIERVIISEEPSGLKTMVAQHIVLGVASDGFVIAGPAEYEYLLRRHNQ